MVKLRGCVLYYGENAMTTKLNHAYTQKPTLTHNIQNIAASQSVSRTHVPPLMQCIYYQFLVTKDLYILKF